MNEEQKPSVDTALADEIAHLSLVLKQQNSWSRRLLIGIVQGVGTVIGATVIAGIVLYIIGSIVQQIPWNDIVSQMIARVTTTL